MIAIVAIKNHFILRVGEHDVAPRLTEIAHAVIVHRVAHQRLSVLGIHLRAVIERGIVGTGVVPAIVGNNRVAVAHDVGFIDDGGNVGGSVVTKHVGVHLVLVVYQMNIGCELGLLCVEFITAIL